VKQYYSYDNFRRDTISLLRSVKGESIDSIVGIARGGLTLAHAVGEGLNIRDVQTLRTELYDDDCKREEIVLFGACVFRDVKKVLVVDDIADSGETLALVMHYLEEQFPKIEFYAATLFYKKSSSYEPHFWVNEATNWIEFFWEKDFCSE
jgi:xanthine phosphoribosyltransferase